MAEQTAAPLPSGWAEHKDPASGNPYFHNLLTNEVTWTRPTAPADGGAGAAAGQAQAQVAQQGYAAAGQAQAQPQAQAQGQQMQYPQQMQMQYGYMPQYGYGMPQQGYMPQYGMPQQPGYAAPNMYGMPAPYSPDMYAQQQQTALGAVDCDLTDELVEALRVELLAHGADPGLARLALQQTLVELLLQVDHVQARGWRARHVLNPEPVLGPLPRREDRVEDVLRHLRLSLHRRQLLLSTLGTWRATLLGPSALRG